MKQLYSDFSGGLNVSSTKLNLGFETKKVYAQTATNVEIMSNYGIKRINGNTLLFSVNEQDDTTLNYSINSIFSIDNFLLVSLDCGRLYSYNFTNFSLTLLKEGLSTNKKCNFVKFLNGVFITNGTDNPMYYNSQNNSLEVLELEGADNQTIIGEAVASFRSRLFVAQGSKLYFSALGNYNDFSTANDAGYIADFHVDTSKIIALKPYQEYLAIYKEEQTYLLSGTSPEDFSIIPFSNKGACSSNGCVTVNNKQYFFSNGLFALSQTGELNQIVMSSEISLNIKPLINDIDYNKKESIILLPYEIKNQLWCFVPIQNSNYINNVFVFDYTNNAWVKREIPQNITAACTYNNNIITADNLGNVYLEDNGNTFNGEVINFLYQTPFFALGTNSERKTIEEFYLIMDDNVDNKFIFSVNKDYDDLFESDIEEVQIMSLFSLVWDDDNSHFAYEENPPAVDYHDCWSKMFDPKYKLEISESLYSVQICIRGNDITHDFALVGIDFKEILLD